MKEWRWILNVLVVFLVSGIWHGAAWTFIVWGLIHGVYQIIEHYAVGKREAGTAPMKILRGIALFCIVSIAWVFFRANDGHHALEILGALGNGNMPFFTSFATQFMLMIACLLLFLLGELLMYNRVIKIVDHDDASFAKRNLLFMSLCILLVSLLGQSGVSFVYFQF